VLIRLVPLRQLHPINCCVDADEADGWVLGLLRLPGGSWKLAHFGILDRLRLVLIAFFGVSGAAARPPP